jgi:hypothetical protein
MASGPTQSELEQAHCLELETDRVPRDPSTTAFRQEARLRQARWRERRGYPIGHEPIRGGPGARLLGSRIELEYAIRTGANLMTPGALAAARHRVASRERGETLNSLRLWADLLSSMPLCFNLFGDLQRDPDAADRAVHAWWPDTPGRVSEVRFEWSPGRLDPRYLGDRTAFDVALLLAMPDGTEGVIGVEMKYHEVAKVEKVPSGQRLPRYREVTEVAEREGVFRPGALDAVLGTPWQQIWRDHLLALSMAQHPNRRWPWVRFAVVHPARNGSIASAVGRYQEVLAEDETFSVKSLENLLDTSGAIAKGTAWMLRERYLGRD